MSAPFHLSAGSRTVRLGLIGDNIARSRSPDLHRIAGELAGVRTTYDRLIPRELGADFDAVFAQCAASGYRGINITYPYKELAAGKVHTPDPLVRDVGAVNTVIFEPSGPHGYNTDLTGFMAAYRGAFGAAPPGRVALIGAGGVGKAIAFGLLGLGAAELRITDKDAARAAGLVQALAAASSRLRVSVHPSAAEAVIGTDGIINCTPVGMVGYDGTPVPADALHGASWAFDAVYTPVDTTFLRDAAAAGLICISGFELFFHQGIQAFRIFTGLDVPEKNLRQRLIGVAASDQGQ
ncbi:shikimate dehydrogenase family protein [Devosia sp. CN2-171]|uniref:shikimate dehydrogenase family protein n=1 Tax=Devosia sp. CN2-171 TaxID=3400909 RepID=UPI003BF7B412